MTQVAGDIDTRLDESARFDRFAPAGGADWLAQLRREALGHWRRQGIPTRDDEEWRTTNVSELGRIDFVPGEPDDNAGRPIAGQFSFGREAAVELVFVNGHFSPSLSRTGKLPGGLTVGSLAEWADRDDATVRRHLGRYAQSERHPFAALNTGFIRDGAYVHVARNSVVDGPIHLLFIAIPSATPSIAHPRVLVVAEHGSVATIVESYVGEGRGSYFTNAVTEMVIGENSHIDHCKLQQEALEAYHLAHAHVELGRSAVFVSHAASLGGRITRNDLAVMMNGEGADATLNGLVVIGGSQHVDNHTLLHHEKPNCPSHELYKHVLDGRATGVFKGKIFVQKDAQKTDSKQTSKSLLLSDDAKMLSQPALEIYADDVKCTHGSTIGPVDEEMVFYLRSRGVSLDAARHLLTYAFAADVTRRIKVEPVRRRLEDFMAAQHGLPLDLRITDLAQHDEAAL